jgi:hypothetical protein
MVPQGSVRLLANATRFAVKMQSVAPVSIAGKVSFRARHTNLSDSRTLYRFAKLFFFWR